VNPFCGRKLEIERQQENADSGASVITQPYTISMEKDGMMVGLSSGNREVEAPNSGLEARYDAKPCIEADKNIKTQERA
jgi:hypothetical protein